MPEFETDRTENSRRKSHETLETSQLSAQGQRYKSKDRTSECLLDDESHDTSEHSHKHHDEDFETDRHHENEESGLKGKDIQSTQNEQVINERNEREGKAKQDKPLTEEQMNALTRDLTEQPTAGMGNERQSEDVPAGDQRQTDTHDDKIPAETNSGDFGKVHLKDDPNTISDSDQKESKRDDVDESSCKQEIIDTHCDDCNESQKPCEKHDKSGNVIKSTENTDDTERVSQQTAETKAKTEGEVKEPSSPSTLDKNTADDKKDMRVKCEDNQQTSTAIAKTTSDEKTGPNTSGNDDELKENRFSGSGDISKEEEMKKAKKDECEDGSEQSDKPSYDEDDPRTEHVDRNRETGALAKTNEALVATAHKLAYEAKHLAVRVKDAFTKERHHEVEIWPDGVVVGDEPENQPEPAQFIKSAHDVVVKYNEREESDDFDAKPKDCSNREEICESPEQNASDSKEPDTKLTADSARENARESRQQPSFTSQSNDTAKEKESAPNQEHSRRADSDKNFKYDESGTDAVNPAFPPCNPVDLPESERAAWWDNLEREAAKRINELSKTATPMEPAQPMEALDDEGKADEKREKEESANDSDKANASKCTESKDNENMVSKDDKKPNESPRRS